MTPDRRQSAIDQLDDKLPHYQLLRRYIDGDTDLRAVRFKTRSAFGPLLTAASDNLLPAVVMAASSRLTFGPFTFAQVDEEESDRLSEMASIIARVGRLPLHASMVHREAIGLGDAYIFVDLDENELPVFIPQPTETCTVGYDGYGRLDWGAQRWIDGETGRSRLTIYTRESYQRYIASGNSGEHPQKASSYVPYDGDEGKPAVVPNVYGTIPLFKFANGADVWGCGRSDIEDCLGITDLLNKTLADLMVAQEFFALPQRYASGMQAPIDPKTGQPAAPFIPGGLWFVSDKSVTFGQFEASDIRQFVEIAENHRKEIARVTATPMHYFSMQGDFPSGQALRTAEMPLQNKITLKQQSFGMVWEMVMSYAMRISGVGGAMPVCNWVNSNPREEGTELDNALKRRQLGVSQSVVLKELGYTSAEIRAMEAENGQPAQPAPQQQAQPDEAEPLTSKEQQ